MESHNHNSSHGEHEHEHGSHHVLEPKLMVRVGVILLTLTVLTVVTSRIDLGMLNFPLAMAIASTKAILVILFFMGLKYERRENMVIFGTSFLFLAIFLGFTVTDLFFRGDVYVKKGEPLMFAVQGKAKFKKPWVATPEIVAHGKELFAQNCTSCHGVEGKGDGIASGNLNPKPRNFTQDAGWKNGRKPSEIFGTLTHGLNNIMPSFGSLPAEDRWSLAHFVRTLGPAAPEDTTADLAKVGIDPTKEQSEEAEKVTIPVEVAMDLMAKEGGEADSKPAVRLSLSRFAQLPGAALYAAQCASCHGATGEGMEVRALGAWPKVVVRTAAFSNQLESVRTQSVFNSFVLNGVPGNSMPSYAQLSSSDVSDLYAFIRALATARSSGGESSTQAASE